MFLGQMVEDYTFEDIKVMFENDKYFTLLSERYSLTEVDERNFNTLKESNYEYKIFSLEVLTLKKDGLLPAIFVIDHEDEIRHIKEIELEGIAELASYPVDMSYSKDERRSLHMLVTILLEYSYYKLLEESNKNRADLKSLGGINISNESNIEEV